MEVAKLGFSLEGKRALVCGSTQGIGRACAHRMAQLGAQVTLLARDEQALQRVRAELPGASQQHAYLVADFDDAESLPNIVAQHVKIEGAFEILLNNTGGPPHGPIVEAPTSAFLTALRRHLFCNQLLLQTLLRGMKDAGYGRVINIISISVKEPIPGLGVSNTTRWSVAAWAKTCAGELGKFGITVNNVLPGYTDTARLRSLITSMAAARGVTEQAVSEDMVAGIPTGRLAAPEEIAAAVGFLASPAAAYINGINLPVDGGRLSSI